MSDRLTERLNQILPRVTSDDFLSSRGLGNEIAFYIFDYPPEAELRIRDHVATERRLSNHTVDHCLGYAGAHVRFRQARGDRVDTDTLRSEFHGQGRGNALDRCLRARIRSRTGHRCLGKGR